MFTRKLVIALSTLTLFATGALAGCSADVANGEDEVVDESEADLSAAGKALIGAYKDDSGSFRGLILTSDKVGQSNKFIADVDTGIVCITTPCPSSERIEGTFTAGSKTITFKSATASVHVQHLLGKFNYLVQGDKFSLSRKNFAQSLEKVSSYCGQPTDCDKQGIIHIMCAGGWTCSAESTCSYQCGAPPPLDPCMGKDLSQCTAASSMCQPKFGPSACSPDGRICTADMAYKGCFKKPAPSGTVCLSSSTCASGEHCSVEDGVCNSQGMLAVCAGTCVN